MILDLRVTILDLKKTQVNRQELLSRTKQYAIANARLVLSIPVNMVNRNYCDQLARSASSTGANYRAACRAKSKPDFINKLKIVEEELDETMFFLEILVDSSCTKMIGGLFIYNPGLDFGGFDSFHDSSYSHSGLNFGFRGKIGNFNVRGGINSGFGGHGHSNFGSGFSSGSRRTRW